MTAPGCSRATAASQDDVVGGEVSAVEVLDRQYRCRVCGDHEVGSHLAAGGENLRKRGEQASHVDLVQHAGATLEIRDVIPTIAGAEEEDVLAGIASQEVVSRSAAELIVAGAAVETVVSILPVERVA